MKYLIIIFGICISHYAFAQSKMSIDVASSFDYNDFKYNETFLPIDDKRADNLGYTTGIKVNFGINNKKGILFLETGILYSHKRYYKYNVICSMIDLGPGAAPCPSVTLNRVSFLEVPISIRVNYLVREKFTLFVAGGVSALIKINEKITDDISPESKEWVTIDNKIKIYPGLIFSTGLEYKISDRTSLKLIPMIKYHKTDFAYLLLTREYELVDWLLSYELSGSFSYRIGKKEQK